MLRKHRHANQATPIAGHKGNGLWRDLLGCHTEVSLILAVLVITEDDHLAAAELCQHVRNGGKRHW